MCIGIPVQVIQCDDGSALCDDAGNHQRLDIMRVGEQPAGTWLLAFQGTAVRVLSSEEALQTRAALAALDAARAGDSDFDLFFADLVSREPTLPPHLRPNTENPSE